MKASCIITILIVIIFNTPFSYSQSISSSIFSDYRILDVNNVVVNINNIGKFRSPPDYGGALWKLPCYWSPFNWNKKAIVYDQGIWVIGKIDNRPYLTFTQWQSVHSPGPIINGQAAMVINPQDSLKYRVYKVSRGDDESNPDFAEWSSEFGAPIDKNGYPVLFGDQMLWTVYNGYDSTVSWRNFWNSFHNDSVLPMPVEIQQIAYAHQTDAVDSLELLSNVVFFEWTIINKGTQSIDSTFIGFWTDIDFFDASSNYPGVDSLHQIGYCWSGIERIEDKIPPAVGYVLLYGPIVSSDGDNAIFTGREVYNYKNLPLSSFHPIGDDGCRYPIFGDISSLNQAWNVARGFDLNGNMIIDTTSNKVTKFPFNGDPATGAGWIFPSRLVGGGSGFVIFSGPFDLAPNDTQWVMIALVPGLGKDRFDSINKIRDISSTLRSLPYDSLAKKTSTFTGLFSHGNSITNTPHLFQNYPNPFNASTKISYTIAEPCLVKLSIFNLLGKEIKNLVNERQASGSYQINWTAENLPSGTYFCRLKSKKFRVTNKLILLK